METLRKTEPLASLIDHTLLKPEATPQEIEHLCQEAIEFKFASVCVNSVHLSLASSFLRSSNVKPITVVGFPLGASTPTAKAFEAQEAIQNGAQEIDMVLHVGSLKTKDFIATFKDIHTVIQACASVPVKVILETARLSDEEKVIACTLAKAAGAAFVKTSTGFGPGGATQADVMLLRRIVGPEIGVKASGGIRTYEDAVKMVAAGANRIGTSCGVAIIQAEKDPTAPGRSPGFSPTPPY